LTGEITVIDSELQSPEQKDYFVVFNSISGEPSSMHVHAVDLWSAVEDLKTNANVSEVTEVRLIVPKPIPRRQSNWMDGTPGFSRPLKRPENYKI
jgi:hypothetical protein